MATFVIATKHKESFRITDFVRIQEKQTFDGEQSSINVITQKKILNIFGIATNFEQL
jgi:hypothetical protein